MRAATWPELIVAALCLAAYGAGALSALLVAGLRSCGGASVEHPHDHRHDCPPDGAAWSAATLVFRLRRLLITQGLDQ